MSFFGLGRKAVQSSQPQVETKDASSKVLTSLEEVTRSLTSAYVALKRDWSGIFLCDSTKVQLSVSNLNRDDRQVDIDSGDKTLLRDEIVGILSAIKEGIIAGVQRLNRQFGSLFNGTVARAMNKGELLTNVLVNNNRFNLTNLMPSSPL
jgi:hypothetical protein